MNNPLVSIALCTFNGASYLSQQLESLFAQSYRYFEIVAFDDRSSDGTVEILKEFARRDARLRFSVNPRTVGLNRNFEQAFLECRGEFIAPCDQDDLWHTDKIAALLSAIGEHKLAYCNSEFVDTDENSLNMHVSDLRRMITTDDPSALLFNNCVSGHATLFARDILDVALPIPDEFDYDWWLAACAAALGGIVYTGRPLVKYRQHTNNASDLLGKQNRNMSPRYRGFRILDIQSIGRKIALLSQLPGPHQPFLTKLDRLWRSRESQWFSFELACLLARHGARLHAIDNEPQSKFYWACRSLKYVWGLRLKSRTNPYAYTLAAPNGLSNEPSVEN